MENNLSLEINAIVAELSKDKSEGSYYYSWQANIAMNILDQLVDEKLIVEGSRLYVYFHEAANNGAKRFLDQLCHTVSATKQPEL